MKAILRFDPERRQEQLDFVRERVAILHEVGDVVWVTLTEEQAARFTEQGIQVQPHEEADVIQLPAVVFDPEAAEPVPFPPLSATMPSGESPPRCWSSSSSRRKPSGCRPSKISAACSSRTCRCTPRCYLLTAGQSADVRARGDFVSWVGLFHPAYAELRARRPRGAYPAADLASLSPAAAAFTARPEGSIRVSFFADRDPSAMRAAIEAAGAHVVTDSGYDFIVNIGANRVVELLGVSGVKALEAHRTETLANQRAGVILGTNQVRSLGAINFLTNLDGTGEIIGVVDSGLDNGVFPTAATGPLGNAHPDFCAPGVLNASGILRVPPPAPDPIQTAPRTCTTPRSAARTLPRTARTSSAASSETGARLCADPRIAQQLGAARDGAARAGGVPLREPVRSATGDSSGLQRRALPQRVPRRVCDGRAHPHELVGGERAQRLQQHLGPDRPLRLSQSRSAGDVCGPQQRSRPEQ